MFHLKTTIGFLAAALAAVLLASLAYAAGQQTGRARDADAPLPVPVMVNPGTPAPPPPFLPSDLAPAEPAALSSALSYYFISGNTFTTHGNVGYTRQVIGCVNQMPVGLAFTAPVHLPQGSQVVTITLFTYDSVLTTTTSTAQFLINDGQGFGGYTLSASSRPNVVGHQQNSSTSSNPTSINNQNTNYSVSWYKPSANDSPILSLCGVRVAYYAPLGVASLLPMIRR